MEHPTDHSIKQLTYAFNKATRGSGEKAVKGTKLYTLQTDFAYILNNIKQGPNYMIPKWISIANQFINDTIPSVLTNVTE